MRCFLALDLPEDVADGLDRLAARLTVGRHVLPEAMHLTLLFMEDAPLSALEELHMQLEMTPPPPMALSIAGVDIFGSDPPRSVHGVVKGTASLVDYQRKVATFARRSGIALPHRRFVPHITLARFANRLPPEDTARIGRFLQAHGDFTWPAFAVPSVSLYRSTPGSDGGRHDVLHTYGGARPYRPGGTAPSSG